MQPPVVRKKIAEFILKEGRPVKVQELEDFLQIPYGNVMQACTRAAAAGEFIKTSPAEFALKGVAYYSKTTPRHRSSEAKSVSIPRHRRRSADVVSPWINRKIGAD
jgi:hypothetical protein